MNTLVSSIGESSISKPRTRTNHLTGRIAMRRKQAKRTITKFIALINLLSSDEGVFDWFKSFKEIESILNKLIPNKSSHILMLGCGNSTLSEDVSFRVNLRKLILHVSELTLSSPRCTTLATPTLSTLTTRRAVSRR